MKFWAGFAFYGATMSLYQDMLGKDAYINIVREQWVSAWITVPLALLIAVVAVVINERTA